MRRARRCDADGVGDPARDSCRLIAAGYKGYSDTGVITPRCLTMTQKKGSADFCELSISAIFVYCLTLISCENQQLYSREGWGARKSVNDFRTSRLLRTPGPDGRLSRDARRRPADSEMIDEQVRRPLITLI